MQTAPDRAVGGGLLVRVRSHAAVAAVQALLEGAAGFGGLVAHDGS
ncbi:hypothetical protein [Janibacter limosus]|nr:hypothetical protein [Janibacter limosus]